MNKTARRYWAYVTDLECQRQGQKPESLAFLQDNGAVSHDTDPYLDISGCRSLKSMLRTLVQNSAVSVPCMSQLANQNRGIKYRAHTQTFST